MSTQELTQALIKSYQETGGINHLDGKNLPSRRAVGRITEDLLRLLFPGFFDESAIATAAVRSAVSEVVDEVAGRLTREIARSIEYAPPPELPDKDPTTAARLISMAFLARLPAVREVLATDVEAAYNGDPAALSKEEVIVAYPFVEAIAAQRMAHELYLRGVALIPRMMTEWAHGRSGMDLHPGAEIGDHFFVDHCTGTVVGETSAIGNHVKMYQGVGLVARSLAAGQQLRGKKRHPTIEDNVTIYAGATIVGGETVVGEGSTIGANAFLLHSVPPRSLVLADDVRVRVIAKDGAKSAAPDWEI
ncbi:MAG: serine O-acetyltransferase [Polyangia bacterium]|jgi:serine O-acetyltransferase